MREWFKAQLAAGFPGFAGSSLSGTLAINEELLNELIASWLADDPADGAGTTRLDVGKLRAAIKSSAVRAESGRILVDFEMRL